MHIPRSFCMKCNTEMVIIKTGLLLEAVARWGSYYKVYSDMFVCPGCGAEVALPATEVLSHCGRARYGVYKSDSRVTFSDNFKKDTNG